MSQLTYEELYKLIEQMTPIQRKHPVKMYIPSDGELHPEDESTHPDISWSSKLILAKDIYEDDLTDEFFKHGLYKNQYVIMEYMEEEDSKKCLILHYKEMLLRNNLTFDQRQNAINQLNELGVDLIE